MKEEVIREEAYRLFVVNRNFHELIHSWIFHKFSLGEITPPQFYTLSHLADEEEIKMSELAQVLHISRPAMTGLIDKLARKKLVARRRESADRRIIKVALTKRGEELIKKVRKGIFELFLKILRKLTPQERKELARIQEKLFSFMKNEDMI